MARCRGLGPPSILEALPVPIRAARAWLGGSGDEAVADIEGQPDGVDRPGTGARAGP